MPYIPFRKYCFILLLLFSFSLDSNSQGIFNFQAFPKENISLQDFNTISFNTKEGIEGIFIFTLFNQSQNEVVLKFRTQAKNLNSGSQNLGYIGIRNNVIIQKIEPDFTKFFKNPNKPFPRSSYFLNIQFIQLISNKTISQIFHFQNFMNKNLISLKTPGLNENITDLHNLNFYWEVDSLKQDSNAFYLIEIKPKLPWQSPQKAFQNNPNWLQKKVSGRNFIPNQSLSKNIRYAWQVHYYKNNQLFASSKIGNFNTFQDTAWLKRKFNSLDSRNSQYRLNNKSLEEEVIPNSKSLLGKIQNKGQINLEKFSTTRENKEEKLVTRSQYTRIRVQNKLEVLHLPLTTQFFLTDENPNGMFGLGANFPMNHVNISLDHDRLLDKARIDVKNKMSIYEDLMNEKPILEKPENSLKEIEKIENYRKSLQHYDSTYLIKMITKHKLHILNHLEKEKSQFPNTSGKFERVTSLPKEESKLEKLYQLQRLDKKNKRQFKDSLKKYNPDQLAFIEEMEKAQKIKDLAEHKRTLDHNLLKTFAKPNNFLEKAALNVNHFDLGSFSPDYASLALANIQLNGINLGYRTNCLFIKSAAGTRSSPFYTRLFRQQNNREALPNKKRLLAAKAGIGEERSSHIALTALRGTESQSDYLSPNHRVKINNLVIGTHGQYSLGNRLSIKGELMHSFNQPADKEFTIRQKKAQGSQTQNAFRDVAFTIYSDYRDPVTHTRMQGEFRSVGPGYYSVGAPFLMRDQQFVHGRIEQPFLNHQITLSPYYKREQDRLMPWKNTQTITIAYGGNAGFHFQNLPYLMVNYAPHHQRIYQYAYNENENGPELYSTQGKNLNLNAGYDYKLFTLRSHSNVNYNYHDFTTVENQTRQIARQYSLTHQLHLGKQASLQFSGSLLKSSGSQKKQRNEYGIAGSKTFFGKWRNRLGGTLCLESGEEEMQSTERGYSIHFRSSLPLWKSLTLDLRVEKRQVPESGIYPYGVDRDFVNGYVTVGYKW